MARDTFGKGIGEGKLEMIGDPRYGLIEEYDSAVSTKTKEYYRTLPEKTRTIKDYPELSVVKLTKQFLSKLNQTYRLQALIIILK